MNFNLRDASLVTLGILEELIMHLFVSVVREFQLLHQSLVLFLVTFNETLLLLDFTLNTLNIGGR